MAFRFTATPDIATKMLPDYLTYWGLTRPPFSMTPDPAMLFLSAQHQECLMRLKYTIYGNKGGALLVSENAGDGKTSLLLRLVGDLQRELEGKTRVAFLDHPTLTPNQMIEEITRQFGVEGVSGDKVRNLSLLRAQLQQLHEEGYKAIVLVDEGQMLAHRPDILQELRILLNFCVADAFLLSFILSGQKPLEPAVRQMPEFWQRLPVRFFLRNLNLPDTRGLIRYRLKVAGLEGKEIFTDTAYEGIYRFSQGCPRVICSVADLALVVGHSSYARRIDFTEVSRACADMNQSGDGYHYFHFLRAEGESAEELPAGLQAPSPGNGSTASARAEAAGRLSEGRSLRSGPESGSSRPLGEPPRGKESGQEILLRNSRLNRDFLSGVKRLKRGQDTLDKREAWVKRYGLGPADRFLLIFPRRRFWRTTVRANISQKGLAALSQNCGLAVGEKALFLVLQGERVRLPYEAIRGLEVQDRRKPGEKRPEGEPHQMEIVTAGEDCYGLSFPFLKEEGTAFARLLEGYIKAKRGSG
ncbi:MAG: AAA family ATPase [Candidatus Tectomicrobia bacterium]|uniref:AAA family ATPase n=1 Tax=Tectimicrobiota bacterium TaxID=2528274 RepID=A0A932CNF0_UNCTE|nr:AAA family ATPase [Candidatus Tectomicrobia bacterium]